MKTKMPKSQRKTADRQIKHWRSQTLGMRNVAFVKTIDKTKPQALRKADLKRSAEARRHCA
jgi:hypothetical protein